MLKWKKTFVLLLIFAVFLVPQISSAAFGLNLNQNGVSGSVSGNGFNFSGSTSFGGGGTGWNIGDLMGYGLPSGSISGIIKNLLSWLLMIFGFLGLIGFVISGIMYVLSAGNEGMIDKAKTAMTYSAIGIIVGLVGLIIIQAITIALNATGVF